jgi:hypothetical protein
VTLPPTGRLNHTPGPGRRTATRRCNTGPRSLIRGSTAGQGATRPLMHCGPGFWGCWQLPAARCGGPGPARRRQRSWGASRSLDPTSVETSSDRASRTSHGRHVGTVGDLQFPRLLDSRVRAESARCTYGALGRNVRDTRRLRHFVAQHPRRNERRALRLVRPPHRPRPAPRSPVRAGRLSVRVRSLPLQAWPARASRPHPRHRRHAP